MGRDNWAKLQAEPSNRISEAIRGQICLEMKGAIRIEERFYCPFGPIQANCLHINHRTHEADYEGPQFNDGLSPLICHKANCKWASCRRSPVSLLIVSIRPAADVGNSIGETGDRLVTE